MGIVIAYDVSDKNSQMKMELKSKGYTDYWNTDGVRYNLPNTTLFHPNKNTEQGLQDMKDAAARLTIRLQRAIAVPSSPFSAIPGDPHSN
ncbi:MAG: hypothetical protein NDI63_00895 [Pseudobdellovibrio sp.]|nr:hypothetical protein [Pseudobdellovibrio sp.]